jgi:hypothetical protein
LAHKSYEGHFLAPPRNFLSMTRNNVALFRIRSVFGRFPFRFAERAGNLSETPPKSLALIPRFYTLYIGGPRPAVGLSKFTFVYIYLFYMTAGRARGSLLTMMIRSLRHD